MATTTSQKLALRLMTAAFVIGVATVPVSGLSAQARATVQVSVTIVPAVQPMPLVRAAELLLSADAATTQGRLTEELGGLAQIRTAVERPRDQTAQRQARVTIEYAAN
jgi:hypothetical protein